MVLAISTALSLCVGELTVRYLYRDITTTADNGSYFARRWRAQQPPRLNRLKFREREIDLRPATGVYRIAVVGDSFTYGQGIAEEERMTNILERRLNDSGGSTRYEVLNFGRPGSETVDHIDILRHSVLANRPDFVVLQWYVNDVQGPHRKDRSTAWGLPPQRISRWLHARSGLYYLANAQWGRLQRAIGLAPGHEDHYVREFGDPDAPGARAAHDALLEFVKLCRDAGIPVGIVTFPDLVENLLNGYPLGFLLDRVMALCRELGIPCVDLRREFARITPTSRLWVNRLDRHPGPLANQLAADVVLERFGMIWVGHEAERVRQATR